MDIFADLHIHGRFSRATSTQLSIPNLEKYALLKGLNLLGTGDFTHPLWLRELKATLTDDGSGILSTKTGFHFVLQAEISSIYSQDNRGRKVHNILLAPDFATVDQINEALLKRGRLDYDGRPIFGIKCPELMEMMHSINEDIELIPAHAWTPWFSIFGSESGFDSVQECFQEQANHIHALETGLSSDPGMNWRLSALDKYALISNSDSHSFWPWRIGRECNKFSWNGFSYKNLLDSIRSRKGFLQTIEFWPHEGKYHYDGHRNCNVCLHPRESIKIKNICPVCRRPLTIGVLHRVEQLADRPDGFVPKDAVPYKNLIPLSELIAGVTGSAVASKRVWEEYNKLLKAFGNELNILLNVNLEELKQVTSEGISEMIVRSRMEKINFQPGYDGVYGKPIFDEKEEKAGQKAKHIQHSLDRFIR